jgi:hypothetical protein
LSRDDFELNDFSTAFRLPWQVPFARSSLNHDDVFVLDTESTIFQFNGETSSIQERGKALEVVQYIKDTDHDGKCEVIIMGKESDEAFSFSMSELN